MIAQYDFAIAVQVVNGLRNDCFVKYAPPPLTNYYNNNNYSDIGIGLVRLICLICDFFCCASTSSPLSTSIIGMDIAAPNVCCARTFNHIMFVCKPINSSKAPLSNGTTPAGHRYLPFCCGPDRIMAVLYSSWNGRENSIQYLTLGRNHQLHLVA